MCVGSVCQVSHLTLKEKEKGRWGGERERESVCVELTYDEHLQKSFWRYCHSSSGLSPVLL